MKENKSIKRHIRRFEKRFPIILYHLSKIIEEWGMCTGLSANDKSELETAYEIINSKSQKKPFVPYAGQTPDEWPENDCPKI